MFIDEEKIRLKLAEAMPKTLDDIWPEARQSLGKAADLDSFVMGFGAGAHAAVNLVQAELLDRVDDGS